MRLSSAFLCEQLGMQYEIKKQSGISGRDAFLRPLLGQKKGRKDSRPEKYNGHVCVVPVDEEKAKGTLLNIAAGEVLSVCCAESIVAEVLNFLQELFDRCDEWDEKISHLMTERGAVGEILEVTENLLGNPLAVTGADFSLVAQSGIERLPEKARPFTDEGINVDYMNAFLQDKTCQELSRSDRAEVFPDYINGYRFMNRNLYEEGRLTYRLTLFESDRPITDGEICFLEALAGRLEALLASEIFESANGDLEPILLKIISDRSADYVEMSHRLSDAGWKEEHVYLCLVLQLTYLNQKQLSVSAICNFIKNRAPDSISFTYKEEVVTFFNLTRLQMDEEEIASKFTYFIRDTYLKAGYSRAMQGHMNLRRQYVQAGIALDVGSREKPYQWIHHFNQIALPYMLEQVTRRLPADMICHEGLLELMKYDEKNHTEYVLTLKTYLEQNLNATQAAKALFIHRSTFLYRMDRIREFLNSDLDDPDELFYLDLSLRLLEQKNV